MLSIISLEGHWHFYADEEERYTGFRPEHSLFTDTCYLPGTTAQSHKGTPNQKREESCLTEVYPYKGNAWFRREVHIPEALRGRRLQLCLERTRITEVWVNGQSLGTQNSLCTPHIYDLSAFSGIPDLQLCICVNNAHYPTAGGHMTSKDTQTNWNGITGRIELRFFDDNCIFSVRAEPDAARREVTLRLRTGGTIRMLKAEGEWVSASGAVTPIAPQMLSIRTDAAGEPFAVMPLGSDAPLWDEYNPVIARLTLRPFGSKDAAEVSFGLKDFRAAGDTFTSHGRRVFLRGRHDGMLFPLEGAAPTDVDAWLRVMGTAKEYGLNHVRFHTCCPPDAAFTAADLLGIYLEPELPFWGTFAAPGEEDFDPEAQRWLVSEGARILETFGNHPSFCMLSLGNELWGSAERLGAVMAAYHRRERRILFTQGSNNFQFWPDIRPEDDFFVGVRLGEGRRIRGSYPSCDQPGGHIQTERPSAQHSYDALLRPDTAPSAEVSGETEIGVQQGTGVKQVHAVAATGALVPDKPVVTHEIGQFCSYPDLASAAKYTGVLKARNLEIFRERLARAGMADRAQDFLRSSGKLAVQCYREEIEAALRSEHLAGFQLLDLQDFMGQGTAIVGILDAFLENKGFIEAQEWRSFCSDSVLLGLFPDYCLTERLAMDIRLRHHRSEEIHAPLHYTVRRGQNLLIDGEIPVDVTGQGLFTLGAIRVDLPPATAVHRIVVTLELPHTQTSYTLWQFPVQEMPSLESSERLCVTQELPEALQVLAEGGRVLYLAQGLREKIEGTYCTDFWCYPMFRDISERMDKPVPVGTLGLCIDKHHPAVKAFRSERWTTPPWYDLVSHAELAILDGLPVTPIVQMIDNFERNHRLGLLFECSVGNGRLLVCTARLGEIAERYEVRQFAKALLDYAGSPQFHPTVQLTAEEIERVLAGEEKK